MHHLSFFWGAKMRKMKIKKGNNIMSQYSHLNFIFLKNSPIFTQFFEKISSHFFSNYSLIVFF